VEKKKEATRWKLKNTIRARDVPVFEVAEPILERRDDRPGQGVQNTNILRTHVLYIELGLPTYCSSHVLACVILYIIVGLFFPIRGLHGYTSSLTFDGIAIGASPLQALAAAAWTSLPPHGPHQLSPGRDPSPGTRSHRLRPRRRADQSPLAASGAASPISPSAGSRRP
jgi:hypothetical protein